MVQAVDQKSVLPLRTCPEITESAFERVKIWVYNRMVIPYVVVRSVGHTSARHDALPICQHFEIEAVRPRDAVEDAESMRTFTQQWGLLEHGPSRRPKVRSST